MDYSYSVGYVEGSLHAKTQLALFLFSRFDTILAYGTDSRQQILR